MPRRRYWGGGGGGRRSTAAPKPVKVVAPKLDISGLARSYDWFLFDKLIGVRMAIEWFATNYKKLLFNDPLDADRQKAYDRAIKSKEIGDSTTEVGEKVNAYRRALLLYEKVWPGKGLPSFAAVDTADAATQPSGSVMAVKTVLTNLNGAFAAVGVTFAPTLGDARYNEGKVIMLPIAELDTMVTQPPLKTAMAEVVSVAQTISLVWVGGDALTGTPATEDLDSALFFANLPKVLDNVYTWAAATVGGNISRPVGKAPRASRAARTATPKPAAVGGVRGAAKFGNSDVITVINPRNPFKGSRGARYAMIQNGMTVRQFKSACQAAGLNASVWPIEAGVSLGLLSVS